MRVVVNQKYYNEYMYDWNYLIHMTSVGSLINFLNSVRDTYNVNGIKEIVLKILVRTNAIKVYDNLATPFDNFEECLHYMRMVLAGNYSILVIRS